MKRNTSLQAICDFPIIILCGGKSSRMGENKTFLPFGENNSLISFQFNRLQKFFNNVFISSKFYNFDFLEEKSSKLILDNNDNIYSPLIALKSILTQVNTSKVFILTVDTPFVSIKTIEKLIISSDIHDITIASTPDKTHNLCGVFSTCILPIIDTMLNENIHKIAYLIKQSNTQIIEFKDDKEFLNMNTKSDYLEALDII